MPEAKDKSKVHKLVIKGRELGFTVLSWYRQAHKGNA
jgi:hypothetical protein